MENLEELQNEYGQLEHEWFIQKQFDRPPTADQMDKLLKLAKDVLNLLEEVPEGEDFEEMRMELKHRINAVIDGEVMWKTILCVLSLNISCQQGGGLLVDLE